MQPPYFIKNTDRLKLGITSVAVFVLIGFPASVRAQARHAVRWTGTTAEDLGPIGGANSFGVGINASGQVSGYAFTEPHTSAVRWTGTTAEVLEALPGGSSAYGINDSGQVAGTNGGVAVRWTGATAEVLDAVNGAAGVGVAINASGQVAGYAFTSPHISAVRWTGTTAEVLDALPGGDGRSYGLGINASGQVVGYASTTPAITGANTTHAIRWTGTTAEDLGTLGGFDSQAFSINAFGDVVGVADTSDLFRQPFLYTGGTMYDLKSLLLPGSGVNRLFLASDGTNLINDLGQIAAYGFFAVPGGQEVRGFRLDPVANTLAYSVTVLDSLYGGGNNFALGINASGQIAGYADNAVPEPSSALLLLGSGWIWLLRRRRWAASLNSLCNLPSGPGKLA